MIVNFIERYFYIICFATYARDNVSIEISDAIVLKVAFSRRPAVSPRVSRRGWTNTRS